MAWTTPRTWTTGEFVTDTIMNAHVRDNLNAIGARFHLRKTADQSVNNSATLVNDTHLSFAIAASEVWTVQCVLFWTNNNLGTGAVLKVGWTFPAGCTGTWDMLSPSNTTGDLQRSIPPAISATLLGFLNSTSDQTSYIQATIVNSTTAGTVQMQWAQSSATVGNTTIRTNSTLVAERIA